MAIQEGHDDEVQTLLGAGAGVNIATSDVKLWRDVCGLMRVWRDVIRMQWQKAKCTINKIATHLPLPGHNTCMYTQGVLSRLKKCARYSGVSGPSA